MEVKNNQLCCGCLSNGRKMKLLHDYWIGSDQAFIQVLTDILMPIPDAFSLWLCWECEARISHFVKFKEQLINCCQILQDYLEENHKPQPETRSKLKPAKQSSLTIDLSPYNDDNDYQVKDEHNVNDVSINKDVKELKIKDEEVYSDDDRSLIDIRNEKLKDLPCKSKVKKKVGKAKVKKKKKQDDAYVKIVLDPDEVIKERTQMELREEYANSMFKCQKCIVPFPNEDDLKEHVLTKHDLHASKHTCLICERTFGTALSLAYHSRRHTQRWRCLVCSHSTATERGARRHHQEKHKESEIYDLATKAYETYGDKSLNAVEVNGTKSEEQIPCEYCEKTFRWKTSLRKHMETHRIEAGHKRRPYCEPCRLSFTTTSNLRKHVKTSSKHQIQLKLRKLKEDPPVETADPAQQAKDIESIKSKINSQKEQFPCPQCEKKFQWKGNLWRHLQSHAARANGDLVCQPCNRTFSSIATFKQHMKISRKHVSENEFKYMCSDCGKRFANKTKLRDHIDWEHLKHFTHTCSHCQKVFKSHTSLYLHRQVVHKLCNAEHLCDHCGKSFPNKTKLRSHMTALHTRESPYKCASCSARFSWHSCLSRHVRRVHRPR